MQYLLFGYRQVLNSEGLTFFTNASYGFGRPGTDTLHALDYRTRSQVLEAGLSYPVIRSREKNLTVTGLGFVTNDYSYILGDLSTRDRIRGFRVKADADWADSIYGINAINFLGINQVNVTFSQGINGLGSTDNRSNRCWSATLPPTRAASISTRSRRRSAGCSRCSWNFSAFVAAYAQYAFTPLLVSEQCGYGGRFFGRAFDPSQMLGDHCWAALGELRYDVPTGIKQLTRSQLYAYADHGQVYNIDPALGTPLTQHGTSAGGGARAEWEGIYSADLSVAKAVEGPRNDWRVFLILGREALTETDDATLPQSPPDRHGADAARADQRQSPDPTAASWSAALRRSTIPAPRTSPSIRSATRRSSTGACSTSASARRRRSFSRTRIRSRSTASPAAWARARSSAALDANGKVFVVNRDGIIFGAGAVINTAGFLATTSDIKQRRLHGRPLQFPDPGPAGRLDRQHGHHHGDERRLRGAGRARRAQFRHHHGERSAPSRSAPAIRSTSISTATG